MKHTKLPWETNGSCLIKGENREMVSCFSIGGGSVDVDGKANAAFIVKACNSHYQLLEAIKDLHRAASFADYTKELDDAIIKSVAAIKEAEL